MAEKTHTVFVALSAATDESLAQQIELAISIAGATSVGVNRKLPPDEYWADVKRLIAHASLVIADLTPVAANVPDPDAAFEAAHGLLAAEIPVVLIAKTRKPEALPVSWRAHSVAAFTKETESIAELAKYIGQRVRETLEEAAPVRSDSAPALSPAPLPPTRNPLKPGGLMKLGGPQDSQVKEQLRQRFLETLKSDEEAPASASAPVPAPAPTPPASPAKAAAASESGEGEDEGTKVAKKKARLLELKERAAKLEAEKAAAPGDDAGDALGDWNLDLPDMRGGTPRPLAEAPGAVAPPPSEQRLESTPTTRAKIEIDDKESALDEADLEALGISREDLADERADTAAKAAQGETRARLIDLKTNRVQEITVKGIVVGRTRQGGVAFVVNDPLVSRKHCRVFKKATGFFVEDLGSSNGTYLNNRRIGSQPLELKSGDRIVVGVHPNQPKGARQFTFRTV